MTDRVRVVLDCGHEFVAYEQYAEDRRRYGLVVKNRRIRGPGSLVLCRECGEGRRVEREELA